MESWTSQGPYCRPRASLPACCPSFTQEVPTSVAQCLRPLGVLGFYGLAWVSIKFLKPGEAADGIGAQRLHNNPAL